MNTCVGRTWVRQSHYYLHTAKPQNPLAHPGAPYSWLGIKP